VWADGWRMRGADTRTGSGGGRVGACAAARHGMARVRGLRLARGLCEIGVVWVEVCEFVAAAVGRGWQRRERAGRRPLGQSCGWIGLRFGVLGLCGWLALWCVCWRRDGALVGETVCGVGASVCGGRLIVACDVCRAYAASPPTSCFAGRCGRSLGGGPVF
jgi:hypothetical protein